METTVAVVGSTGKTGRQVVSRLLPLEDIRLHLYVRSRSKLVGLFPSILSNPRVSIYEAPLVDVTNMSNCLKGTQRIIFTLGENDNIPGTRVLQDGAKTIMDALARLKETTLEYVPPRIIVLSSSTWNEKFAAARPRLLHWAIKNAFVYAYADLRQAHTYLLADPSLASVLLVQPGALVDNPPTGHEISTESIRPCATYGDLASGLVEFTLHNEYDKISAVGVSSKDGDDGAKYGPSMVYMIVRGLCATFVPGFWTMNHWTNWAISKIVPRKKADQPML